MNCRPKTAENRGRTAFTVGLHPYNDVVQVCLVGRKGSDPPGACHSIASDVICSERRGQSQKPEEIYEIIEELVPNGGLTHYTLNPGCCYI